MSAPRQQPRSSPRPPSGGVRQSNRDGNISNLNQSRSASFIAHDRTPQVPINASDRLYQCLRASCGMISSAQLCPSCGHSAKRWMIPQTNTTSFSLPTATNSRSQITLPAARAQNASMRGRSLVRKRRLDRDEDDDDGQPDDTLTQESRRPAREPARKRQRRDQQSTDPRPARNSRNSGNNDLLLSQHAEPAVDEFDGLGWCLRCHNRNHWNSQHVGKTSNFSAIPIQTFDLIRWNIDRWHPFRDAPITNVLLLVQHYLRSVENYQEHVNFVYKRDKVLADMLKLSKPAELGGVPPLELGTPWELTMAQFCQKMEVFMKEYRHALQQLFHQLVLVPVSTFQQPCLLPDSLSLEDIQEFRVNFSTRYYRLIQNQEIESFGHADEYENTIAEFQTHTRQKWEEYVTALEGLEIDWFVTCTNNSHMSLWSDEYDSDKLNAFMFDHFQIGFQEGLLNTVSFPAVDHFEDSCRKTQSPEVDTAITLSNMASVAQPSSHAQDDGVRFRNMISTRVRTWLRLEQNDGRKQTEATLLQLRGALSEIAAGLVMESSTKVPVSLPVVDVQTTASAIIIVPGPSSAQPSVEEVVTEETPRLSMQLTAQSDLESHRMLNPIAIDASCQDAAIDAALSDDGINTNASMSDEDIFYDAE